MSNGLADKINELIDIYDKNGQKTGIVKKRGEARSANQYNLVVNVFIVNQNSQILIQQRSFNKIGRPGAWEPFVSGSVLSNETSIKAAMREVLEETGLNVSLTNDNFVQRIIENNTIVDYYAAKTSFEAKDIVLQKSEVEQVKLVNSKTIYRMFVEDSKNNTHQKMILHFLERNEK